jgi:hypothetical protein
MPPRRPLLCTLVYPRELSGELNNKLVTSNFTLKANPASGSLMQ